MSEQETVELKLRLPKVVMDLLRAVHKDPERYLVHSILQIIVSDLDGGALADPQGLIEKFNLAPVLKEHGIAS
jgi:hypothetical protein